MVRIIDVSTGSAIQNINPGNEDRFHSVEFSPTGSHLVIGTRGDLYIVETTNWQTTRSEGGPAGTVNSIDWSPDGKHIAVCEGYEQSQGGSRVRLYQVHPVWTNKWTKSGSTSCYSSDFSPDGTQVIFGFGWYAGDGATAKIYDIDTGNSVDDLVQPRPNNCTSTGGGNNCGQNNGLSWSPDGSRIAQAFGKDDEGVYLWFADLDPDGDGTTQVTKAMERSMLFQMKALNGKTLTTMGMAIIHFLHSKAMHVPIHTELVSKTDSDALMETEMDIQMKETHSQATLLNGQTPTPTDMVIITTMTFNNSLNFTSTREVTHSL